MQYKYSILISVQKKKHQSCNSKLSSSLIFISFNFQAINRSSYSTPFFPLNSHYHNHNSTIAIYRASDCIIFSSTMFFLKLSEYTMQSTTDLLSNLLYTMLSLGFFSFYTMNFQVVSVTQTQRPFPSSFLHPQPSPHNASSFLLSISICNFFNFSSNSSCSSLINPFAVHRPPPSPNPSLSHLSSPSSFCCLLSLPPSGPH